MDPFSAMLGISGLALQVYGMGKTKSASKDYNEAQIKQYQLEQQADNVRRQVMETQASRQMREAVRAKQRASALAVNNAASQGAQFGSGLQGGLAQISGDSGENMLGIRQSLYAGRQMFDINAQIGQAKMSQANAQMGMQEGQAWGAIGGSLINAMGPMKQLTGGFGGASTGMWDAFTGGFMRSGSFRPGR